MGSLAWRLGRLSLTAGKQRETASMDYHALRFCHHGFQQQFAASAFLAPQDCRVQVRKPDLGDKLQRLRNPVIQARIGRLPASWSSRSRLSR